MNARILVIEDEPDIADLIASRLRGEGFAVDICHDGAEGVRLAASLRPDLVVLDVMLPSLSGTEVCRQIQQKRPTPVIMLTAKTDETDVLVGLGVGADDYIKKPFSPRELVARVHAILRRASRQAETETPLVVGDLVIHEARRLVERAGEPTTLTATEFDLLHALAKSGGAVLSREQLLYKVWGYRDGSGARTVDSHVRAVRRKLGDDVVRTVHGVGYALGLAEK